MTTEMNTHKPTKNRTNRNGSRSGFTSGSPGAQRAGSNRPISTSRVAQACTCPAVLVYSATSLALKVTAVPAWRLFRQQIGMRARIAHPLRHDETVSEQGPHLLVERPHRLLQGRAVIPLHPILLAHAIPMAKRLGIG